MELIIISDLQCSRKQSIDKFSYGVSDRGASIRIPVGTIQDGWKGRLEDRRPASNGDPYKIAAVIIKTTKEALSKKLFFHKIKRRWRNPSPFLFSLHNNCKLIIILTKEP